MSSDMDTVMSEVEKILELHPSTRNNDFYLSWLYLMSVFELPLPILTADQISGLGGILATIRRCRQVIQNDEHRYPPTDPKVMTRRRQREEDFREWLDARKGP